METRLALVIVVDGLRASALGTYGNTTFPTPHLDDLAARSLMAEWLIAESPLLSDFYSAAWEGMHSNRNANAVEKAGLPEMIQQAGGRTRLLTDDPWVAEQGKAEGIIKTTLFEQPPVKSAKKVSETHTARFIAQAIEQLAIWQKEVAEDNSHGLLWIHLRGLTGPWDAPLAMRARFLDEEDPALLSIVDPPASLDFGGDPDELFSFQVGYGAQVELLDSCIAGIVEAFEQLDSAAQRITMIAGSGGFALGEHGKIGHKVEELYSEQLHLPWLMLMGGNEVPLPRVSGFAHPADLRETLLDWFGIKSNPTISAISLLRFLSEMQVLCGCCFGPSC